MTDTRANQDKIADYSHPLKNLRHEKFCQLYVTNPFNIGVIYGEAGYKCSSGETDRKNAYKLLRIDAVRGRIDYLVDERNKRLGLNGDEVVRGLYQMRDRCAGGEIVRDRQGKPVTEWADVDGKEKLCIVWKSDVQGFLRASELLAKYHGLLVERSENVNVNVGMEKLEQDADELLNNIKYGNSIKPKTAQERSKENRHTNVPVDSSNYIDTTKKSDIVVYDEDGKVHA